MTGSGLAGYWQAWSERIEAELAHILPAETVIPTSLHKAMRYTTLGGGKRLRGFLAVAAADACCGTPETALPLACSLEAIHAYSLIHDDLPCMDDDDFRRGKPSNHRVFGEATAVLAGDGLLSAGFAFLADRAVHSEAEARRLLRVIGEVAGAAGSLGMVGGQSLDLEAEGLELTLADLERVHRKKTGALIKVAARGGAILAGAGEEQVASLDLYADSLGLAFQITDDLLDVTGDEERLGKPVHSDAERHKATYPGLLGIAGARVEAQRAVDAAEAALQPLGSAGIYLAELARFVLERDR